MKTLFELAARQLTPNQIKSLPNYAARRVLLGNVWKNIARQAAEKSIHSPQRKQQIIFAAMNAINAINKYGENSNQAFKAKGNLLRLSGMPYSTKAQILNFLRNNSLVEKLGNNQALKGNMARRYTKKKHNKTLEIKPLIKRRLAPNSRYRRLLKATRLLSSNESNAPRYTY
jgi:hypothetical protein